MKLLCRALQGLPCSLPSTDKQDHLRKILQEGRSELISVADPEFTVLNCFSYFFFFQWCTGSLCSISENKRGKGVCTSLSHNGSAAAESHVNPSVKTAGQRSHTREWTVTELGALVPHLYLLHVNYPQVHQLYEETFSYFMSETSVFLLYVHITGTYLYRNIVRKLYNFYVL